MRSRVSTRHGTARVSTYCGMYRDSETRRPTVMKRRTMERAIYIIHCDKVRTTTPRYTTLHHTMCESIFEACVCVCVCVCVWIVRTVCRDINIYLYL